MILTLEAIEETLRPVHIAIARADNKELTQAGIGLHNFAHGAKTMSVNLAQELQVGIELLKPEARGPMQSAVLTAYQAALGIFVDETKKFLDVISKTATPANLDVKKSCEEAAADLTLMASGRANDANLPRRGTRFGPGGGPR